MRGGRRGEKGGLPGGIRHVVTLAEHFNSLAVLRVVCSFGMYCTMEWRVIVNHDE